MAAPSTATPSPTLSASSTAGWPTATSPPPRTLPPARRRQARPRRRCPTSAPRPPTPARPPPPPPPSDVVNGFQPARPGGDYFAGHDWEYIRQQEDPLREQGQERRAGERGVRMAADSTVGKTL